MNWAIISATIAFASGWILSSVSYVKSLLFYSIVIQPESTGLFMENMGKMNNRALWDFSKSIGSNKERPVTQSQIIFCLGRLVWLYAYEEMLKAGYNPKQYKVSLSVFRWDAKWMVALCEEMCAPQADEDPYIYMCGVHDYYFSKFNVVPPVPKNYVPPAETKEFLDTCDKVMSGEIDRTGLIMCGKPGNGKSTFIKYLSHRYKTNLYSFTLAPEKTNDSVLSLFKDTIRSQHQSALLFEDFDNTFDGRKPNVKEQKYSFDTILNGLDGPYFHHKNRIFLMTTNHLEKIDPALRRPGRFDFVLNFADPTRETIIAMLPEASTEVIDAAVGLTIAEISALSKMALTVENVARIREMFGNETSMERHYNTEAEANSDEESSETNVTNVVQKMVSEGRIIYH